MNIKNLNNKVTMAGENISDSRSDSGGGSANSDDSNRSVDSGDSSDDVDDCPGMTISIIFGVGRWFLGFFSIPFVSDSSNAKHECMSNLWYGLISCIVMNMLMGTISMMYCSDTPRVSYIRIKCAISLIQDIYIIYVYLNFSEECENITKNEYLCLWNLMLIEIYIFIICASMLILAPIYDLFVHCIKKRQITNDANNTDGTDLVYPGNYSSLV